LGIGKVGGIRYPIHPFGLPANLPSHTGSQTFIAPLLATEAPELLETEPFGFPLSFATFALGWLLFGVAALRARVYPRWAAVLLIVGAAITFFPFLPTPAVILGVAVACLGFLLFTGRGASAEQPSRVN